MNKKLEESIILVGKAFFVRIQHRVTILQLLAHHISHANHSILYKLFYTI